MKKNLKIIYIDYILKLYFGLNKIIIGVNFTSFFHFYSVPTRKHKIICVACICGSHYILNWIALVLIVVLTMLSSETVV